MRAGPLFFRWHRWLATAVALQVLAWVLGGLLFAWLPFQGWVKGNDWVRKPVPSLPQDWAEGLSRSAATAAGGQNPPAAQALHSVMTARGAAWRLRTATGDTWLAADGSGVLPAPDEAAVGRFAQSLYGGPGRLLAVQRLAEAPTRWGLVKELGVRENLWLARFDDPLQTRLYFDGTGGELLAVRTEAWVLYDFFWRLHVMDYSEGEDFNNPLLRAFSLAALALVLTGTVLVGLAGTRSARRWRRRRPTDPHHRQG